MGVYIKGMDMPTSCEDCPMAFSVNFGILCTTTHNIVGDDEISKKQGFCPLIPVPPHGDLIDRDALMQHEVLLPRDGGHMPIIYASYVRNAPTIIPAESEEEMK